MATTKKPAFTADQVAASLAANPQAAGANGSLFIYQGQAGPMADQPGTSQPSSNGGGTQDPFQTDPGYLAALAAQQAGSQQADAALRAAQEAAIVGYGDPSIAAALGIGDLSANTGAAARANYLSGNATLARLDKQRGLAEQTNVNNLAAHGIVSSGELGYQLGQIGQQYGNNVYDAQQALLGNIGQARSQNLAAKQGLQSDVTNALTGAYTNMINNPSAYGAANGGGGQIAGSLAGPTAPTPTSYPGSYDVGGQLVTPKKTTPGGSRLGAKPLTNPYTTGQKLRG